MFNLFLSLSRPINYVTNITKYIAYWQHCFHVSRFFLSSEYTLSFVSPSPPASRLQHTHEEESDVSLSLM